MTQFPPRAFIRMAAEQEMPGALPRLARQSAPDTVQFLSLRDVLARLTVSRSLLYELMKDPVRPFPAPVHIRRRSVWLEEEVEAWMLDVLQVARQSRAH